MALVVETGRMGNVRYEHIRRFKKFSGSIYACGDDEAVRRHIRTKEKNRIDNALHKFNKTDRTFARAVLDGKSWRDLGLIRFTFSVRLKKVEKKIHTHK